jgi:hypothetical protein
VGVREVVTRDWGLVTRDWLLGNSDWGLGPAVAGRAHARIGDWLMGIRELVIGEWEVGGKPLNFMNRIVDLRFRQDSLLIE